MTLSASRQFKVLWVIREEIKAIIKTINIKKHNIDEINSIKTSHL